MEKSLTQTASRYFHKAQILYEFPCLVMFLFTQLHLSFSLSTGGEDGLKEVRDRELIPVQSLNLLLKSIGATLTDAQDVVFKYENMQRPKQKTHIHLLLCDLLLLLG